MRRLVLVVLAASLSVSTGCVRATPKGVVLYKGSGREEGDRVAVFVGQFARKNCEMFAKIGNAKWYAGDPRMVCVGSPR